MEQKKNPPVKTAVKEGTLLPFLLEQFPKLSRNTVKTLLKTKQVFVNGKPAVRFDTPLSPGDRVSLKDREDPFLPKLPFPILYEDEDIIVIHKPAGLLAVATEREKEATAYHFLTEYQRAREKGGRVFIVHRLDRDTSGVLLFAKNEDAKHLFQDQWEKIVTLRRYQAVAEGTFEEKEGTKVSYLLETESHLVFSGRGSDGKKAVTHYQVIKESPHYSLLQVDIDTGRKNQIRVHLKELGHPVAGDKKYKAKTNPIHRLCLHASLLSLTDPRTNKPLTFRAPVPASFQKLLKEDNTYDGKNQKRKTYRR